MWKRIYIIQTFYSISTQLSSHIQLDDNMSAVREPSKYEGQLNVCQQPTGLCSLHLKGMLWKWLICLAVYTVFNKLETAHFIFKSLWILIQFLRFCHRKFRNAIHYHFNQEHSKGKQPGKTRKDVHPVSQLSENLNPGQIMVTNLWFKKTNKWVIL